MAKHVEKLKQYENEKFISYLVITKIFDNNGQVKEMYSETHEKNKITGEDVITQFRTYNAEAELGL